MVIVIEITNKNKNINTLAPYKLVKTMRAGVLVLGSLLTKYKKAKVSLPGGCAIGTRPVDLHLFALKKLPKLPAMKSIRFLTKTFAFYNCPFCNVQCQITNIFD